MRNIYRSIKKAYANCVHLLHRIRLKSLGSRVIIESGVSFQYPDNIHIGNDSRISRNTIIRANGENSGCMKLGESTTIMENCVLSANGGNIHIADNVWLGPGCLVYGNAGVRIGSNVLIAGHSAISTVSHKFERTDIPINHQGLDCAPIVLEDDVWIGLNCSIVKGVTIGQGSIIGAGAVVTSDIPPFSIAVGVPAKVVGSRTPTASEIAA